MAREGVRLRAGPEEVCFSLSRFRTAGMYLAHVVRLHLKNRDSVRSLHVLASQVPKNLLAITISAIYIPLV